MRTIIAPISAILHLIERCQPQQRPLIQSWIIKGLADPADQTKFEALVEQYLADEYVVSYAIPLILDCPVKRYFESHLAKSLFLRSLDALSIEQLNQHLNEIKVCFTKEEQLHIETFIDDKHLYLFESSIGCELKDNIKRIFNDVIEKKYDVFDDVWKQHFIKFSEKRIRKYYQQFRTDIHEKLEVVVTIFILNVVFSINNLSSSGLDLERHLTEEARGRISKDNHNNKTQKIGLIKSSQPISYFDDLKDNISTVRSQYHRNYNDSVWTEAIKNRKTEVLNFNAFMLINSRKFQQTMLILVLEN